MIAGAGRTGTGHLTGESMESSAVDRYTCTFRMLLCLLNETVQFAGRGADQEHFELLDFPLGTITLWDAKLHAAYWESGTSSLNTHQILFNCHAEQYDLYPVDNSLMDVMSEI